MQCGRRRTLKNVLCSPPACGHSGFVAAIGCSFSFLLRSYVAFCSPGMKHNFLVGHCDYVIVSMHSHRVHSGLRTGTDWVASWPPRAGFTSKLINSRYFPFFSVGLVGSNCFGFNWKWAQYWLDDDIMYQCKNSSWRTSIALRRVAFY